jgi:hypothetical protein
MTVKLKLFGPSITDKLNKFKIFLILLIWIKFHQI